MIVDKQQADRIDELFLLVSKMADRFDDMSQLILTELQKVSNPASTMGIQGKADAIRKALQSGDKKFIRQTMKEISDNN